MTTPFYNIGFTAGVWDLLHPGHTEFLAECKQHCDDLWVGLQTSVEGRSGKDAPIQTVYERYLQLSALSFVDNIIPYETEKDLELILHFNDFSYRFIGSDYMDKPITGADICEQRGIEIRYIDRTHWLSSTELRNRIKKG